ncbi:MAG: nitroreductase family protein [Propionibacteriaceae bacterium]|nr:nitroreductase family protein [Propionibacteriaceae bacterium]
MDITDLVRAIENRHSVRKYVDQPIPEEVRGPLDAMAQDCNQATGLSMKVVYDHPEAFRGGSSHYGRLEGVSNYILLSGAGGGADHDHGYFGQKMVLLAQHLGLNTCWAGLTFNKKVVRAELDEDKDLALVIALGYGLTPGKAHKTRGIEKLGGVNGGGPMPDWFVRCLEAVALAPSARHQQKYFFELDGNHVTAHQGSSLTGFTGVDLGIAKLHFEIASEATLGPDDHTWNWSGHQV